MDAFTDIFTPLVASASEQTSAPVEKAKQSYGMQVSFCTIA